MAESRSRTIVACMVLAASLMVLAFLRGDLGGAEGASPSDQTRKLTARIDELLAAGWVTGKVTPAAGADDAEFLRRLYLDLAGRIPSLAEARAFFKDTRPDKRERLVGQLLTGTDFPKHFANVWRHLLVPSGYVGDFGVRIRMPILERWLVEQFQANAGYDRIVRTLLTAGISDEGPFRAFRRGAGLPQPNEPTPSNAYPFYFAHEYKPEKLATATSRVFLGVRMGCAECHNHPFAKWKREQFWQYAAVLTAIPDGTGKAMTGTGNEVVIPGTQQTVPARFLDGSAPRGGVDKVHPRVALADWMTAADNPYFARAAVNRLWAHFFGTGLAEPVDDFDGTSSASSPSHCELLDELARQFAAHGFDMKFLIRAITASRAYQLRATGAASGQDAQHLFARMPLRALTPEQLLASLEQATGSTLSGNVTSPRSRRLEFLGVFGADPEASPIQARTSIQQVLSLMNGAFIAEAIDLEQGEFLPSIVRDPQLTTEQRVEVLFLATLSRPPRQEEMRHFVRYIEGGGPRRDSARALADVFWALLNSGEFILNH